jgi:transposase-like protein
MAKASGPRKRRKFTPEFKAEAVRLCRVGDRSIGQVATGVDPVSWTPALSRMSVEEGSHVQAETHATHPQP